MKILAIDSTAIVASSAVCEIENGAVGRYCLFTLKNGMTHSENLLPLVDGALTAGGYDLSAIDLIAVSAGPGSFTGVRIGVATVKGLAYSGDKPVCGVSTLDALYRNIAGMAEVICPVMDARRHQFYNAVFVNGVKVTPDRCAAFENIYAELEGNRQKGFALRRRRASFQIALPRRRRHHIAARHLHRPERGLRRSLRL